VIDWRLGDLQLVVRTAAGVYLLRTGCPWRYLDCVYNIFRKFQRDGVCEAIWAKQHMALRERLGREASPSAAVLDSQSVKPAEKGGSNDNRVGYDAGKQVNGHKIHTTAKGCRCGSSSIPPRSRTATGPVWCSTRYADASRGSN
jgi:transposase